MQHRLKKCVDKKDYFEKQALFAHITSRFLAERSIHNSQILIFRQTIKGVRAKYLEATLLFVDFSKTFDSITSI